MSSCLTTSAVVGCFSGQPVVIHYTYDNQGTPVVRITNLVGTVVPGANLINTTPGPCTPVPATSVRELRHRGVNIASGTASPGYAPTGAGSTWTYVPFVSGARLQSVTVTALVGGLPSTTNRISVVSATAPALFLAPNQTTTWSVAQDLGTVAEALHPTIQVVCIGNSAATVHWTEEAP